MQDGLISGEPINKSAVASCCGAISSGITRSRTVEAETIVRSVTDASTGADARIRSISPVTNHILTIVADVARIARAIVGSEALAKTAAHLGIVGTESITGLVLAFVAHVLTLPANTRVQVLAYTVARAHCWTCGIDAGA